MLFSLALSSTLALVTAIPLFTLKADGQACSASDEPVSCSTDPSTVDSCCVNTPGGVLLQTQFWTTSGNTAPANPWGIHGLWPDNCGGGFAAFCDKSRESTDVLGALSDAGAQATVDFINTFWVSDSGSNEKFLEHEWDKHGTCVSTIAPACYGDSYLPNQDLVDYFNTTITLFQTLPTYDWLSQAGIVPDPNQTYALSDLQAVANAQFGFDAVWNCKNGALDEVWWAFDTIGALATGQFVPTAPLSTSTCPDQGIQYLPKQ